jgi:hypothetical protein
MRFTEQVIKERAAVMRLVDQGLLSERDAASRRCPDQLPDGQPRQGSVAHREPSDRESSTEGFDYVRGAM